MLNGWLTGWMGGWMNEKMVGWVDGWMSMVSKARKGHLDHFGW